MSVEVVLLTKCLAPAKLSFFQGSSYPSIPLPP
jgi:hypothetical protein